MNEYWIGIIPAAVAIIGFVREFYKLFKCFFSRKLKEDKLQEMDSLRGFFSKETRSLYEERVNDVCISQLLGIKLEGKRREEVMALYQLIRKRYVTSDLRRAVRNLWMKDGKWKLEVSCLEVISYGINMVSWGILAFVGFIYLYIQGESSHEWWWYLVFLGGWGIGLWISYFFLLKPFSDFCLAGDMLCVFFEERVKEARRVNSGQAEMAFREAVKCKVDFRWKKRVANLTMVVIIGVLLVFLLARGLMEIWCGKFFLLVFFGYDGMRLFWMI